MMVHSALEIRRRAKFWNVWVLFVLDVFEELCTISLYGFEEILIYKNQILEKYNINK